jgi:signal transduction histidine kinase
MNAVTHARDGVAHIRVEGSEVQVWIEDHGDGIEMNRLPEATLRRGHSTAGTAGAWV